MCFVAVVVVVGPTLIHIPTSVQCWVFFFSVSLSVIESIQLIQLSVPLSARFDVHSYLCSFLPVTSH